MPERNACPPVPLLQAGCVCSFMLQDRVSLPEPVPQEAPQFRGTQARSVGSLCARHPTGLTPSPARSALRHRTKAWGRGSGCAAVTRAHRRVRPGPGLHEGARAELVTPELPQRDGRAPRRAGLFSLEELGGGISPKEFWQLVKLICARAHTHTHTCSLTHTHTHTEIRRSVCEVTSDNSETPSLHHPLSQSPAQSAGDKPKQNGTQVCSF